MGYLNAACTYAIPENAKKHGTRESIRAQWETLIREQAITESNLLACEEATRVSDCSSRWRKIKETVHVIAGPAVVQETLEVDETLTRFIP